MGGAYTLSQCVELRAEQVRSIKDPDVISVHRPGHLSHLSPPPPLLPPSPSSKMARLVAVLLLLGLLHPVLSIQCYRADEFHKKIVDGNLVCLAQFDPQDGTSSFSGLQKIPKRFKDHEGCILTTRKSRNEETFAVWECVCSNDLCNQPISWSQFKRNGYTLA